MMQHTLTGLDGSNPLAFLASLGTLFAASEQAEAASTTPPALSWRLDGVWRPILHTHLESMEAVVEMLDADRQTCTAEPALHFTYQKKGAPFPEVKASPEELRASLLDWAEAARPDNRRTLDWFTAWVSEGSVDNNGAAKPTALHFAAGQQRFLQAALLLAEHTTTDDLHAALLGPWTYQSPLPVMGWDNTETRDYALRASNPSTSKKLGNPGADWLAFRGMQAYPTAARRGRQHTAGIEGGWKNATFAWPLWEAPLAVSTIQALVCTQDLRSLPASLRTRRGLTAIHETRILRSDQGGYGSMTPARVL